MKKNTLLILLALVLSVGVKAQEYVKSKESIPSNNANNAIGEKNAIWRNSQIAPTVQDNFPNNQNWWSILQTQFGDTKYDAQLAFGLNKQDLWVRYNFNGNWQGWKEIVLADNNGNVGIGTVPDANSKLTIMGSSSSYPNQKALYIKTEGESSTYRDQVMIYSNLSTGYGIAFAGQGHHRAGVYAENSGGPTNLEGKLTLWARNNGAIILDAGKVGIGTKAPEYKLDVLGTIRAKEIKVDMEGKSADFVFEEDYHLRSLEEVEGFISENKHLPEIASAKEMEENGVNQSEMNQKLLQKIEELTLYMIEQNKQIKAQKIRFDALEKENRQLRKRCKY